MVKYVFIQLVLVESTAVVFTTAFLYLVDIIRSFAGIDVTDMPGIAYIAVRPT